ncbi:HNH endonuclease signature motif containing protein, partial [Streptococcus pyogenes]
MDYQRHYNSLMDRAKYRNLNCYKELHHIIPRCMGGSDDKDNLVYLTAAEHFVAHQLLLKMN